MDWGRLGEVVGGSLIKAHVDWSGSPAMGERVLGIEPGHMPLHRAAPQHHIWYLDCWC